LKAEKQVILHGMLKILLFIGDHYALCLLGLILVAKGAGIV